MEQKSPPLRWTGFRDLLPEDRAGKGKTNSAVEEPGRPHLRSAVRVDVVRDVTLVSCAPDVI